MMQTAPPSAIKRSGFTILELMFVIAIIAFLASISAVMYANFVDNAREASTAGTIKKIHEQLQQRVTAFDRFLEQQNLTYRPDRPLHPALQKKRADLGIPGVSGEALEILVRKDRYRSAFPQQFAELVGPDGQPGEAGTDDDAANGVDDIGEIGSPNTDDSIVGVAIGKNFNNAGNHNSRTESAEVLYAMITQGETFGIPPVDDNEFSTKEVGDTDNDGLLEFLDAWGNPLQFYRWPTRLIKPDGSTINRPVADLLIKGLPNPPSSGPDPLNEDPDDQIGRLTTGSTVDLTGAYTETAYHTSDTYHVPLIVSPGPDGVLGLFEPTQPAPDYGTLAQPGGLDELGNQLNWPADQAQIFDYLTDNITNRNQRAGGN